MDHADLVARLGLQQLNGGGDGGGGGASSASAAKAHKLENLKTLVHSYKKKLSVKTTSLNANKWFQQNFAANQAASIIAAAGLKKGLVLRDEPAYEQLNRTGRNILFKKQRFTLDEARLFIQGDQQLSRQGLIHLCGVEDFDLRSSALVLLEDLLLNEEIDHPSRPTFQQMFAEIDVKLVCQELCLDLHALRPRTRLTAFRLADSIPASADMLMRNNKQAVNLYFNYARANEPEFDQQHVPPAGSTDDAGEEEEEGEEGAAVAKAHAAATAERPHDGLPTTWNELGLWGMSGDVDEDDVDDAAEDDDDDDTVLFMQDPLTGEIAQLPKAAAAVKTATDASPAATFSPYVVDPLSLHVTGRVPRDNYTAEQVIKSLYANANREELVRGLANVNKDLQVAKLQERKLVHDRLNDFIKIRFALESLSRSLHEGTSVAKSAQHSLGLAGQVVDVHLRPLLEREARKTRAKDALSVVRSSSSRFLFSAGVQLDELTSQRDFVRGLEMIEKIQVEENQLGLVSGGGGVPYVFQHAKQRNHDAMQRFVTAMQGEVLLGVVVDRAMLTTFVRVKQRFVSIGDRDVVLELHELKAGQVRRALDDMLKSSRRMDLASRASKIVYELMANFDSQLPPNSIPPNLLVRYESALVALERYSTYALEVVQRVTELELDYVQWTKRLEQASEGGVGGGGATRTTTTMLDCSAVVDLGRDVLQQVLVTCAPPLVPLDCHILLSLARDLEMLWKPSQVLFGAAGGSGSGSGSNTSNSGSASGSQRSPLPPSGSSRASESSASLLQQQQFANSQVVSGRFILWRTSGVLEAVMRLNDVQDAGMEPFAAKTVTGEIISLALDELLAQMEAVQRSIPLMRLDLLLPVNALVAAQDEDVFLAPLLEFCWQQITFVLDQVVRPLLESTKQSRVELVRTLNVQDRFTKSVRVLGTIMGKCAELSRLSRKGFLVLTRDCQLLTSKRIKQQLDYHCSVDELQLQFERLEPALATQYLKACVTTCSDRIPEALDSDPGEDGGVSDVWMMLLHDLSEFVHECESFIGTRYAKKLQAGLAMFLATQIVELVQKKVFVKSSSALASSAARCRQIELDLTFFGAVLELKDDAFVGTIGKLSERSRWKPQDKKQAVERECAKHAWLVASFVWPSAATAG